MRLRHCQGEGRLVADRGAGESVWVVKKVHLPEVLVVQS